MRLNTTKKQKEFVLKELSVKPLERIDRNSNETFYFYDYNIDLTKKRGIISSRFTVKDVFLRPILKNMLTFYKKCLINEYGTFCPKDYSSYNETVVKLSKIIYDEIPEDSSTFTFNDKKGILSEAEYVFENISEIEILKMFRNNPLTILGIEELSIRFMEIIEFLDNEGVICAKLLVTNKFSSAKFTINTEGKILNYSVTDQEKKITPRTESLITPNKLFLEIINKDMYQIEVCFE